MEPITPESPPLPGPAVLAQTWQDLAFIHWKVDPDLVAPLLPEGIVPDLYDGATWVGLIPFRMRDTAVGPLPPVPYFGSFVEVNVRLYGVDALGRRGVVFRSLEAGRLASVLVARVGLSLPYFWSDARTTSGGGVLSYTSKRHGNGSPQTSIAIRPTAEDVSNDALTHFLTARWSLFVTRGSRTRYMRNEHEPWPVFRAGLVDLRDELVASAGLPGVADSVPDSVLYSSGVRTSFSLPERRH
ncbi:YqjF family protein [Agreia sp. COWG]|uniref:YqjF family protein n=1 Tax=Agreia sp. COWG TaxID=2773266 RepID=UPI00192632B9|nr:DUF2071 domain-containing protein [Agreia sp. COWG]CAD5998738.1 conserved protein of unknown function [Agreia sp. COWG]